MSQSQRKIVQYLNEAHASETGLTRTLQAQIAMTPAGSFRTLLTKHLGETKSHAERLHSRIQEIDGASGFNPLAVGIGMAETVFAQALAIGKTPLDLVRGSGGEEKVLKNAKDHLHGARASGRHGRRRSDGEAGRVDPRRRGAHARAAARRDPPADRGRGQG